MSFGLLVYIGLLVTLTLLVVRMPHLSLVAVLCMFGLEQWGQIYIEYLRENSSFTNLYVLMLIAAASVFAYRKGFFDLRYVHESNKVRLLAILLILYALLSTLWAPKDAFAITYWATAWPYLLAAIILAPLVVGKPEHLEQMHQYFIFFAGILMLLLAAVPEWGSRSVIIEGDDEALGLPLALAQLAGYLVIIAGIHVKKSVLSIGWLVVLSGGALMVAILTASRGPVIFSILCLVLVAPLVWSRFTFKHMMIVLLGSGAVVMLAIVIFTLLDAISDRWQVDGIISSLEDRLEFSGIVLDAWARDYVSIVFGLGNSASFSPNVLGIYPHIVPLEVLAEEGLVGFVLLMLIGAYAILNGVRIRGMQYLPQPIRQTYVANFGCVLFTMMLALKQGSLITSPDLFLFAVIGEKYYYLVSRENRRNGKLAKLKEWLLSSSVLRTNAF